MEEAVQVLRAQAVSDAWMDLQESDLSTGEWFLTGLIAKQSARLANMALVPGQEMGCGDSTQTGFTDAQNWAIPNYTGSGEKSK
jgi:hypothetical protein